jgi:hypothetical protein
MVTLIHWSYLGNYIYVSVYANRNRQIGEKKYFIDKRCNYVITTNNGKIRNN